MRIVLQRVASARVVVNGHTVGSIGPGILALLGISRGDSEADADYLLDKLLQLRIFPDEERKMNRSIEDCGGSLMVVPSLLCTAIAAKAGVPASTRQRRRIGRAPFTNTLSQRRAADLSPCRRAFFRR